MAINFPNSPVINETFTVGNITWIWDGITWTSSTVAASASGFGYAGVPQIQAATNTTLTLDYANKQVYVTVTGQTITIPANSSVPFEIGTTLVFITPASVTTTIAINTDTLLFSVAGTTGSRVLSPYGVATAIKVSATSWIISGNGLI